MSNSETQIDSTIVEKASRAKSSHRAPSRVAVRKAPAGPDLTEFKTFLASLGMMAEPSIHINGPLYHHALMVVDFGTPFKQTKITPEQSAELVNRIRKLSRDILGGKDTNVRVSNDSHSGIWWASIS